MLKLSHEMLEGKFVILEPIADKHTADLQEAILDGELWKIPYLHLPDAENMLDYVRNAQQATFAYAVYFKQANKFIGSTRLYDISVVDKTAKIGYTWYAKSFQRTVVNTETKYLLLDFLFNKHQANSVRFETNYLNFISRKAIERLGARQEGVLRKHKLQPNGFVRDTVVFSIIQSEWPEIKNNLLFKLQQ